MTIVLDHMIVPARDKDESARFFARIFGLPYDGPAGHFAAVRVNDTLTLDFDTDEGFERHHYAFKLDDDAFDAVFARIEAEGIAYGSGPFSPEDMKVSRAGGIRRFYFRDPSGHLLEALTG